jgi:hypothetical protein
VLTANLFSAFVTGGVLLGVALSGGRTHKHSTQVPGPSPTGGVRLD